MGVTPEKVRQLAIKKRTKWVFERGRRGVPVKELCRKHGFSDAAFLWLKDEVQGDEGRGSEAYKSHSVGPVIRLEGWLGHVHYHSAPKGRLLSARFTTRSDDRRKAAFSLGGAEYAGIHRLVRCCGRGVNAGR
jgi:hypothetical protein